MLNVKDALFHAQVPAWRGAYRKTEDYPEPPDTYCVYTVSRSPDWDADDRPTAERLRAFLHLYALNDPSEHQHRLEQEMKRQGFALSYATDGYVEGSGRYEVLSEWEALLTVPNS